MDLARVGIDQPQSGGIAHFTPRLQRWSLSAAAPSRYAWSSVFAYLDSAWPHLEHFAHQLSPEKCL